MSLEDVTVDSIGVKATGTLTLTGAITPGSHAESVVTVDTIANTNEIDIGDITYTAVTSLSVAPTVPYEVLIGAGDAAFLDNLKSAINATAGEGTTYSTGTEAHPDVVATDNNDTTQKIVARVPGVAANDIATTGTATRVTWEDTTLGGGTGDSTPGVAAETVTIGSTTYSIVDVLSETNAPAAAIPNQVLFGASSAEALDNLKLAIDAGATEGTNYSTGTDAHPSVVGGTNTNTTQEVIAKEFGIDGNDIATTTTIANGAWGETTLEGGIDPTDHRAVVNVEGYSKIGIQFVAEDITSGNGVFTVEGTIDGTNWVALNMLVDNLTNDAGAGTAGEEVGLTRVASKTLSTNTSALVWLVDTPLKAIKVLVDVTTDGTYSAYVIAAN